jgi:hypothetical protein
MDGFRTDRDRHRRRGRVLGLAGGGFDSPPVTGTSGRVRSIGRNRQKRSDGRTVWITEDNGFLPTTGFLEYSLLAGNNSVTTSHRKPRPPTTGTIPFTVTALAAADLDTSSDSRRDAS